MVRGTRVGRAGVGGEKGREGGDRKGRRGGGRGDWDPRVWHGTLSK